MNLLLYCSVTGLPRREMFVYEFERTVLARGVFKDRRREGTPAVIFFDLNRLKLVNDELGHSVGDWVLEHFSEILKLIFKEVTRRRGQDFICRFGGDEFVVGIQNCANYEEVERFAIRAKARFEETLTNHLLIKILSKEFGIAQAKLYEVFRQVGVSFGLYVLPAPESFELQHALHLADQDMYSAKKQLRASPSS